MQDRIGSMEEGKEADLVLIDATDTALLPSVERDGFGNLAHILLVRGPQVRHMRIAGEWAVRAGELLTVDEEALDAEYRGIVLRMGSAL